MTALFADIVGSTALGERLDPEDLRDVIGEAVAIVIRGVEEFGGTIKDIAGDGALALFGAPEAHEDDAERAVRTGLRIVKDIEGYGEQVARQWKVADFGVRVGIESGLAVLGPVGAGGRVEYGATGDVLNTAARLQSAATPGAVLVGHATYRLVEPLFEWSRGRELTLKGKASPVTAYEVRGVCAVPGRVRGLEGVEAPVVGRNQELATVRSAGQALLEGRGGIMFLVGEPGIGKSRLLAELRAFLGSEALWLEGRCVSYGQASPYLPYRDLLRGWVGASAVDPEERVQEELRSRLQDLFMEESPQVYPFLAAMLGLTLEPDLAGALAALSPEARQFQTVEAVRSLAGRLAEGPVILAVEDLHWSDATSVQLTDRLLPLIRELPLLLVGTLRPERDHPAWALMSSALDRNAERSWAISLDVLPPGADRELLEVLVGKGTLPSDLEERIILQAEGNPFFLEELIRSFVDTGALARADGGWRFDRAVPVQVPTTVEKVILARLDRLPSSAREALDTASVLGREFGSPLLEAVSGLNGSLGKALEELVRLDLLREEGEDSRIEYRFKHVLIQEIAYGALLRKRRRELHARAADALESLLGDRPAQHFGVLAHHHREAGHPERAMLYFRLAGEAARHVYAVAEALAHYSAALELAILPETRAGDGLLGELHLQRGLVRAHTGDIAGARKDLEAALEYARATGDRSTEAEALNELGFSLAGAVDYREALPLLESALRLAVETGDLAAQAKAASRLSVVYTNMLNLSQADESARRALTLARELGDSRSLAMALDALQVASVMMGDMGSVEEISPELARIHRTHGDLWYLQYAIFQWCWVPLAAGDWDRAVARLGEGLGINRKIDDRGTEPIFSGTLCWIARARGLYGEALTHGHRALQLAEELGHHEWVGWAGGLLGWTLTDLFRPEEAEIVLERALAASEEASARIELIRAICLLAEVRWLLGRREQALALLERGESLWKEVTAPPRQTYLQGADGLLALARVLVARGNHARADEMVQPVLAAAEASEWREVIASAALVTGQARIGLEDFAGAGSALVQSLEVAGRGELPGIEWKAQAALAGLRRLEGKREEAGERASAARALTERLSTSIEDQSISRKFVEEATAGLPGQERR